MYEDVWCTVSNYGKPCKQLM